MMDVEPLIRQIEETADPATTARVRRLVEAILEFHGPAIERMLELAPDSIYVFGRDPVVSPVLLLYGYHPEDFATRVRRGVNSLPYLEIVGISDFRVRLRASSSKVSRQAVEEILYAAAPEISSLEIEGLTEPAFVPLEALARV
jgi:hypothetical protein